MEQICVVEVFRADVLKTVVCDLDDTICVADVM